MHFAAYAQNTMWGLNSQKGHDNVGTIFHTDENGENLQVDYYFEKFPGSNAQCNNSMTVGPNSKLYGLTYSGGVNSKGVLFEYDPTTNKYIAKIQFDGAGLGGEPFGSLTLAANGKFYGLTFHGGIYDYGILFEYDPLSEVFTKKYDFNIGNSGNIPTGKLYYDASNKLYGLTLFGGFFDKGVLFEFDLNSNNYTKLSDFNGSNGSTPYGGLIKASNGKLYGMTNTGGINDLGVIFQFDLSTSILTNKVNFDGASKGASPNGDLIETTGGLLYGVAPAGGIYSKGVLFSYDINSNVFMKKFDFDGAGAGDAPLSSLIYSSTGYLYGQAFQGGSYARGTIFKYDIQDSLLTQVFSFNPTANIMNGNFPRTTPVELNGKLYALTGGGLGGSGVLYQFDLSTNSFENKVQLNFALNGSNPSGTLTQYSNTKLYGLTQWGGYNDRGVIFEYDLLDNIYSKKFDFSDSTGAYPAGELLKATNGKLYGCIEGINSNDDGKLFEFDPLTNQYAIKYNFSLNNNGGIKPGSTIIQANNGKLYGTTIQGGNNGVGTIYEYDLILDTCVFVHSFDAVNGAGPVGELFQASNGKLYGLTNTTTTSGTGVVGTIIYSYDPTNSVFSSLNTCWGAPYGGLIEGNDGFLYGITHGGGGGYNFNGTLFKFNMNTNSYTYVYEVYQIPAKGPYASLLKASNGKMYCNTDGYLDSASIVEFDPMTMISRNSSVYYNSSGRYSHGNLIEVNLNAINNELVIKSPPSGIKIYPNPASNQITIESKQMNLDFKLFSLFGETLRSTSIRAEKQTMDLSWLSNGVYFYQIIDENHYIQSGKLIVFH